MKRQSQPLSAFPHPIFPHFETLDLFLNTQTVCKYLYTYSHKYTSLYTLPLTRFRSIGVFPKIDHSRNGARIV